MFLTDKQIKKIAKKANKIINIPCLPESMEQEDIEELVEIVIKKIDSQIPKNILNLIIYSNENRGPYRYNKKQLKDLKKRLVKYLNKKINLPILSEKQESKLIAFVVDFLVTSLNSVESLDSLLNTK